MRTRWIVKGLLLGASVATIAASCTPIPSTGGGPAAPNGQAFVSFGGNTLGQLGDGTQQQRLVPVVVPLPNIRELAAGGRSSLALLADGRVLQWGNGGVATPTAVAGLQGVKQVAAGDRHALAVTAAGKVYAWGDNDRGQLGDGTTTARPTPVEVANLSNVLSVVAGREHSLAILSDLTVWAWGSNADGQLGDGTKVDRLVAKQVMDQTKPAQPRPVSAILLAAAAGHSVALTSDGRVVGWGRNDDCQLGRDPGSTPFHPAPCSTHLSPFEVYVGSGASRPSVAGRTVAALNHATLIVTQDHQVMGLGGLSDPVNQAGLCQSELAVGPAVLGSVLSPIAEVSGGGDTAMLTTAQGHVVSLGVNLAGQTGLGATSSIECPREIVAPAVTGVTQAAAGYEHTLLLAKGVLAVAPIAIAFGDKEVGSTSAASEATVDNLGPAPATIFSTTTTAGAFGATSNCPSPPAALQAGSRCTIELRFSPSASGPASGALRLTSNAFNQPIDVALTGRGTAASVIFGFQHLDFGSVPVGSASAPLTVGLTNSGTAPLSITSIAVPVGFRLVQHTCPIAPAHTLAPHDSCSLALAFIPTVAGTYNSFLRVDYLPTGSSAQMVLTGVAP